MWFIFGFFFFLVLTFAYASVRAAPWVPLRHEDVKRAIRLMELRTGERIYDLGCGDGRIVVAAARTGALATGFEISLFPYLLAKLRQATYIIRSTQECIPRKPKNIRILFRDFWFYSLKDADVVFLFLMPKILPKIREKLEKELHPGSRVVSYVWPLEGWTPTRVDEVTGFPKLYRYDIPASHRGSRAAKL